MWKEAKSNGWTYLNPNLGKFGWSKLFQNMKSSNLVQTEKIAVIEQLRGAAKKSVGPMFLSETFAKAHYSYFKARLENVRPYLSENTLEEKWLFIGNGKDVLTSALADISGDLISGVRYFEATPFLHGDRDYLGDHKIHDRGSHQQSAGKVKLSTSLAQNLTQEWLQGRIGPGTNFPNPNNDLSVRSNALFDTSEFEYTYLKESFSVAPFESQYDGFEYALNRFDPSGEDSVFRMHPNLANAAAFTQVKTVLRILKLKKRFPGILIVWHFSEIDSYHLVLSAKRVVFSNSTIGLESLVAGKEVWRVGTSYFDEVTCIPHIMDQSVENKSNKSIQRAGSFLSYFQRNSFPIADDAIGIDWLDKARARLTLLMLFFVRPSYSFKFFWSLRHRLSNQFGLFMSKAIVNLNTISSLIRKSEKNKTLL